MPRYVIASDAGAQKYGAEVGAQVELELDESDERALVCAGWLEPTKKQAKEAND